MENENKKTITVTTDVTIDVTQLENDLKQYLSDKWNCDRPECVEEIYNRALKSSNYFIEKAIEKAVNEEVKKSFLAFTQLRKNLMNKINKAIDDLSIVEATTGLHHFDLREIAEKGETEKAIQCAPITVMMTREERLAFYREASERLRKRVFKIIDEIKDSDPDYVFDFFKGFTKLMIDEK